MTQEAQVVSLTAAHGSTLVGSENHSLSVDGYWFDLALYCVTLTTWLQHMIRLFPMPKTSGFVFEAVHAFGRPHRRVEHDE